MFTDLFYKLTLSRYSLLKIKISYISSTTIIPLKSISPYQIYLNFLKISNIYILQFAKI